ncbi:xanthine dehydrogenase family protein molybdopterin-binding subunit [Elioraea sp.]|uniref:xanthine dehydrogenase family protein molybdopterin-binding subunit n=1 Tax=Elioraea sp. TaxID=2185103 RepID=UPI0025BD7C1F|nr:xanthine dehydrogenase family protein molybdopterin-binding subunit [Elioraea sp.]
MADGGSGKGVGARLPRKEDDRFLRGKGRFVADIRIPGMREVAFLRGPIAHARIGAITVPEAHRAAVFTASDLTDVAPIRAYSGLKGFRRSDQPVLATGKVRHVGEAVAMIVAATRAEAEDIAGLIDIAWEPLPALVDMAEARATTTRVHEEWPDNIVLETFVDDDLSDIAATAPIVIRRSLRTARQCMSPIEGRGVVAEWDGRLDQLVMWSSAQMPHITRSGLSECLGLDHGQIRVISPDVGGGFGYKGILLPEEVALGWLARRIGAPVRWIEDRFEQLSANANCREHAYELTAYADGEGTLLALDCEAMVDAGAYSSYPFSACLEAAQIASILPGPYRFGRYRCRTFSVATNKPPILPYRGVARTGVCYAIETVMDAIAEATGIDIETVRQRNLVRSEEMPYTNVTNKVFDSGDYPEALRRAAAALDIPTLRAQQASETGPVRTGVGLSIFCEQGAHGTAVYHGWGIPMVPGHEQAQARLTPDGVLELRIGAHSHGQGMETSLAQVAHTILGINPAAVRLVHGDTALTPYSTGTWGSRSAVMSGGAVAAACETLAKRIAAIGAHLLQAEAGSVRVEDGSVVAPGGASVTLREVAHTWYRAPQLLPRDVDPAGLDVTAGYKPLSDGGTFSYAAHACAVTVDTETGFVTLGRYVIAEDGGVCLNPMIVDGQVLGGTAQGIGTALYEEMPYDGEAQPLAASLADYLLPGAGEIPRIAIEHMETPSPLTRFGQKGIGESGAIGPPAAIANAVNDALRPLGARVDALPITPRRILEALARAGR